jgi:hypothetical protein
MLPYLTFYISIIFGFVVGRAFEIETKWWGGLFVGAHAGIFGYILFSILEVLHEG